MSQQDISQFYTVLETYRRISSNQNESNIRKAFSNLLEKYCNSNNLELSEEFALPSGKIPDGTIKDNLGLTWGYWESKDAKDNLDEEIEKKFKLGYPKSNIIFENSIEIVLFQENEFKMRCFINDREALHRLLTTFVTYERPEIIEFKAAVEKFKQNIPDIIVALRNLINEQESNENFKEKRDKFLGVCQESINPEITIYDIREMLIQHILTSEIFDTVFGKSRFHRENNVAKEIDSVVETFFVEKVRYKVLNNIDSYYKAIKAEAARIENHNEKQKFLKVIYENFYKAYNPKGADKLGIVYTPNEIVKFMIESTEYLLETHFQKTLSDENVQILDPATGTGTFITEIIEHIPKQYLKHKYQNEIHCNEISILPYYIANLNIEYTYQQKMKEYEPFENIVFVDTLDNLGFEFYGKQNKMFGMSAENMERIIKQNKHNISVIIGNPPYNANQMNENDNNKNREYKEIDKRIKNTFVKNSTAQKSKVYDMYSRFYRWAFDRIDKNGIIAFITNRSFIDSRTFDGFRKSIKNEFDYIYIVDLKGDIRAKSDKSLPTGNVFSIMTGVAIAFFVKIGKRENKNSLIKYYQVSDELNKAEKLEWLRDNKLEDLPIKSITPDEKGNWINLVENDFDNLIEVAKKGNKNSIFQLYSLGVATNRDAWVYDFDKKNLEKKIKYFIENYNKYLKENDLSWQTNIKWSRDLKLKFKRKQKIKFNKNLLVKIFYRPFTKKIIYSEKTLNDVLTQNHYKIFGKDLTNDNFVICINKNSIDDRLLATNRIFDLHFTGDSLSLPLFTFDKENNRKYNITDWGLEQFREHYELKEVLTKNPQKFDNEFVKHLFLQNDELFKITKEDIFNYTYAVLHNPAYRKKYEINLKRDFPRLPFYKDFFEWAAWGKELINLHINYETIEPYDLKITTIENPTPEYAPKPKLKANKETGEIIIDEITTISGVPQSAWLYKLGNRTAIEWILDQYKERPSNDPTIDKLFNNYKFADYKEIVIDLIKRVTTVSVRTIEIMHKMKFKETHEG